MRAQLASKKVHCADFVHNPLIMTTATQNHGDGWPKNAAHAQNCGIYGNRDSVIFTPLQTTYRSSKSVHPLCPVGVTKRFNSIRRGYRILQGRVPNPSERGTGAVKNNYFDPFYRNQTIVWALEEIVGATRSYDI